MTGARGRTPHECWTPTGDCRFRAGGVLRRYAVLQIEEVRHVYNFAALRWAPVHRWRDATLAETWAVNVRASGAPAVTP